MNRAFLSILVVGLALLLTACARVGQPAALPTLDLDQNGEGAGMAATQPAIPEVNAGGVRASAVLHPAQELTLLSLSLGEVAEIAVTEGQQVAEGDLLIVWQGGAAARATLEAAKLAELEAKTTLVELDEDHHLALAAATLRNAKAQTALRDAERRRASKAYRHGSDANIQQGQADLALARERLRQAHEVFDPLSDRDDSDLLKAAALSELSAAQKAFDRAAANLEYLTAMPDELAVGEADAELAMAQAEAEAAAAALEKLRDGPDPAMVALAVARQRAALAQAQAAEEQLRLLEVRAPLAGRVWEINVLVGQRVGPGAPLVLIAGETAWVAETTDLSERVVAQIQQGAAVQVRIKALGLDVTGEVQEIAHQANALGGDVVYTVRILLAEPPEGLRSGMTADVVIE